MVEVFMSLREELDQNHSDKTAIAALSLMRKEGKHASIYQCSSLEEFNGFQNLYLGTRKNYKNVLRFFSFLISTKVADATLQRRKQLLFAMQKVLKEKVDDRSNLFICSKT